MTYILVTTNGLTTRHDYPWTVEAERSRLLSDPRVTDHGDHLTRDRREHAGRCTDHQPCPTITDTITIHDDRGAAA